MLILINRTSEWQEVRVGSTTCSACLNSLPCRNHYLTFGASNLRNSHRELNSKIALTKPLSLQNLMVEEFEVKVSLVQPSSTVEPRGITPTDMCAGTPTPRTQSLQKKIIAQVRSIAYLNIAW